MVTKSLIVKRADTVQLSKLVKMGWPVMHPTRENSPLLTIQPYHGCAISIGSVVKRPMADTLGLKKANRDSAGAARLRELAALGSRLAEQGQVEKSWHQTIAQDLKLAMELQRSLQPDCDPNELPIWGFNLPACQMSGDFFDFYRTEKGDFAFALGDVSGKGMGAALLMAKTISLFRCLSKRIDHAAGLLTAINAELCETASRGLFVTMVVGWYSPRDGHVRFANGGHEPPLMRCKDRTYKTFPAAAPPLGILADYEVSAEDIDLSGGEFYVFSDGLTEYRYAGGEQLGVEGLIQLVEIHAAEPPARRVEAIIQMLDEEAGWDAHDDLTVLAIDDAWVRQDKAAGNPQPVRAGVL